MRDLSAAGVNVSRETLAKLEQYCALLAKWNARINLVAPSTIPDLWARHIVDSAQIFRHAPATAKHWVDLGSGGGLPALVCAILAQEALPECRFTLVESDKRKAAFLLSAARELQLALTVVSDRAETLALQQADIVSARALAPLPQLLAWVARHLAENGVALLPKGKNYATELAAARHEWQFETEIFESQTDPLARLLLLKGISRA